MSVLVRKTDSGAIVVKYCPKCRQEKFPQEFRADANRFDLLDAYCKHCRRDMWRARYQVRGDDGRSIYNSYQLGSGRRGR